MKNENQKYCQDCGNLILIKAEICPNCGVRQQPPPTPSDKNRMTAVVLALLLGGLGVHKFYLKQNMQGILYLVFCWTFIPVIFAFLEGLNYLFMSEATFYKKYVEPNINK
jgi:TM2 domain-containing membrane protein YozV